MCHVIVTCRSMLWTLFSIMVAFAELIAFMSPDWLLGYPRPGPGVGGVLSGGGEYRPSLGLYSRCLRIGGRAVTCGPYAQTFGEVASGFWQGAMLFLAAGTLVLGCVACMSIFTLCFQSCLRKSIFNICGLLQAIAGKCVCVCVCVSVFVHTHRQLYKTGHACHLYNLSLCCWWLSRFQTCHVVNSLIMVCIPHHSGMTHGIPAALSLMFF